MHICIYIYIERERDLVVVVRQQLAVAWPLRGQSQKCTSKGIGRRGIVLKYRMSLHTNNIYAYTYIYIYIYMYAQAHEGQRVVLLDCQGAPERRLGLSI